MVDGPCEFFIPSNTETSFWIVDIPFFNDYITGGILSTDNTNIITIKSDLMNSAELWHARLGHPGIGAYKVASKMADLPLLPFQVTRVCPTCAVSPRINKPKLNIIEIHLQLR